MNLKKSFGLCLRRLRDERGLTQQQLADMIDKTSDGISQMERGVIAPSFETLEPLAKALGVPVRDLFSIGEAETSPKRTRLLADLTHSIRDLSEDDLEMAVRQVGLVAEYRKPKKRPRERIR